MRHAGANRPGLAHGLDQLLNVLLRVQVKAAARTLHKAVYEVASRDTNKIDGSRLTHGANDID